MKKFSAVLGVLILLSPSCSRIRLPGKIDDGVIVSESAPVRNSTAQLALEVARLNKGQEVEILERKGVEWTRIRTRGNVTGWTESRHLVSRSVIDRGRALAEQAAAIPAQATGRLTTHASLRISPGRSSDQNVALYLPTGLNVEILTRERTFRMSDEILPRQFKPRRRPAPRRSAEPPVKYDFWYQVRLPADALIRVGWIYAQLVELKIPSGLVNLQGDKFIVGWFEVGEELKDEEAGPVRHYLALERDRFRPAGGTDFDRLKLFIWDLRLHQYRSTWQRAYGILPVRRTDRGGLPAFELQVYNERTFDLEQAIFSVDLREPAKAQLARMKESTSGAQP